MATNSAWIEYLKSVDTPTLVNGIELLHRRPNHEGFTPLEIRCLFPELGRMCGYAVTAHVETVTQMDGFELDRFIDLYRLVEQAPKPAVIVLQEIGGHGSYAAHCGEVMASFFTRLGAVGLVSDCAVRDLPEVRNLGFHYFARGSVASHANFRIVRSGEPVQIMGMVVKPGDLLHGDENGLITVPSGVEDKLPAAVDSVRKRERRILDFVRGPEFSLDGFKGLVVE
ncbi:MAG TPA: RraA family protein [Bryobacteraceae bacterium]|nr:RraA family protein [Bryobacteraceae bacterium]